MSGGLIIIVGCIYAAIALDQGARGNTGMAITFCGYAFSNIGLYFLANGG